VSLDAGAPAALWRLFDATGVRPEFVLPVLWTESGLNPATPNLAGFPYYGINQISGSYLARLGFDPSDYLTWPASQQLDQVVTPFVRGNVAAFGVPQSGTRFYQLNFLPATLAGPKALSRVLAWKGSGTYAANEGLDWLHKGAISVYDLAHAVAHAAAQASVQRGIAACYALRPEAGAPLGSTYGADYADPAATTAATAGILWLLELALSRR